MAGRASHTTIWMVCTESHGLLFSPTVRNTNKHWPSSCVFESEASSPKQCVMIHAERGDYRNFIL